jgi:cupin 2 domain-containing protein
MSADMPTDAPVVGNLFEQAQPPATGERFETLLAHRQLQIERIVSSADITPTDYLQPQDEWVLLVRGLARLRIRDSVQELQAGDHLFIPAGTPHRVESASAGALWLTVHLHPDASKPSEASS